MSLCAIIPIANLQSANTALQTAGYGPNNFSVPLYNATGVAFAGLHTWDDAAFETAIKAIAGVVWEQSNGDPVTRFQALVNAQGVKWAGSAPVLPVTGTVTAGNLYTLDGKVWSVIQTFDRGVFNASPETYPALLREMRSPSVATKWRQPIDQFDAYKLVNPFTGKADECLHNGKRWKVIQADGSGNNVWEPGVFGWSEV